MIHTLSCLYRFPPQLSVLSELAKTAADLRQANTRSLEQLAESAVPRLRPVLDEVAAVSYQLSDAEYGAREAEEGWSHRLMAALQTLMVWIQPALTTNNYEVRIRLTCCIGVAGVLHVEVDEKVWNMGITRISVLSGWRDPA